MRAISVDVRPRISSPARRIEPDDGTIPMIALHRVVLPIPLRPTTDSTPDASVTSTPCNACEAP